MKRIVTIQDISCLGKCSLTVALPIISAMGVEACVLPTAVLSTHTAFKGFTFRDLTCDIQPVADHWKKEGVAFDAIYTGYLGSFDQLELVEGFIDDFRTDDNVVFIDPVMGDYGKLYPGFTPEFAKRMAGLCGKADVIVPNMTEAAYMLDVDYRENHTEGFIKDVLRRLADLGTRTSVLTGVSLREGELGVMAYDSQKNEFFSYFSEKVNASYHGTGDVFASCCVGALMNGMNLDKAMALAADYTAVCIRDTAEKPDSAWYGVNFENAIPYLVKRLGR